MSSFINTQYNSRTYTNRVNTMATSANNVILRVGQYVEFTTDVKQFAVITKIEGTRITVENHQGFEGVILGGKTRHVLNASKCYFCKTF